MEAKTESVSRSTSARRDVRSGRADPPSRRRNTQRLADSGRNQITVLVFDQTGQHGTCVRHLPYAVSSNGAVASRSCLRRIVHEPRLRPWAPLESLTLWLLDRLRGWQQGRRKVRVLVHPAVFRGDLTPCYFVNVTNLSRDREVEVTHVWFDVDSPVHVLRPERPLPVRLRGDESWETWIEFAKLVHASNPETLARVRLSSGKIIKSRLNPDVPTEGFVPGGR